MKQKAGSFMNVRVDISTKPESGGGKTKIKFDF
jgi:hypothetical protein